MRPTSLKPVTELAEPKPHGARIKYLAGCRCLDCRAANAAYERQQYYIRKTGKSGCLVFADRARHHLERLSSNHISNRTIHRLSGVGLSIIWMIRNGERQQIRVSTEARLLKVAVPKKPRSRSNPATMRLHATA